MPALRRCCLLAAALLLSSCGSNVDLAQSLRITILDSGWYDAGIVNGQNKLVPSVTFSVKNVSNQTLGSLQVNALFRRVTEKDEWGDAFVTVAASAGLAANAESAPLTLRSQRGYTGTDQSRQEMLANSHFVDAKVEILAKYGSTQWKRIGEYPIQRKLLEKQPDK
jgi:hypothetical protein